MNHVAKTLAVVLVLGMAALAHGAAASGPARTTPAAPAAGASIEEMKSRLMAEAVKGKVTEPLLALFKDYAAACGREKLVPAAVSEEFWNWLAANRDIRDPLMVTLCPEYNPNVLKSLQALHAKFGAQLSAYPHLAVAFALVYGYAGGKSIRDPLVGFTAKGRDAATIEDSFGWYLKNERSMRMPLKTTPWPLLLYVADNDLPLAERDWALTRCGGLAPQNFGKVYYEVAYDYDKRKGSAKIGDRPRTLANILTYGGVCMERAYYSSRIFKSLGVPSLYDVGEGERGGHAWVAWVGREGQTVDLLFSGRFDYDRYYTGGVFSPLGRHTVLDREVQLEVAAAVRSYRGYFDAVTVCNIYILFEGPDRAKVADLLDGAIQKNPYCPWPWLLMAQAVADGVIPPRQGEKTYDAMLKSFASFPDLTIKVLARILAPRFKADPKPKDAEIARNAQILEKAFLVYEAAKRPDLSVQLRALQGQYLEAVGRREEALKLYVMSSEKYVTEHFGFVTLFNRAAKLMLEDKKQDLLLKYMKMVADKVPEYQSEENRRFGELNPTFTYVVKAYAKVLRDSGNAAEASFQESRVAKRPPAP